MPSGPLSIGELLDRAVTLLVRNFWIFAVLAGVLYVPIALTQLGMLDLYKMYADLMSAAMGGSIEKVRTINQTMAQSMVTKFGISFLLQFAVALTLSPIVTAAITHATSNLLLGQTGNAAEALRYALPRWGRVMLYVLLWVVATIAAFIALALVTALAASAAMLFAKPTAAIALVIIAIVLFYLALAVLGLAAWVAFGVGLTASTVEGLGAGAAFATAFKRTWTRAYFWRSVLIGLVLLAISMGISTVTSAAGFGLLALLHTGIPLVILNSVFAIVNLAITVIVIVLYYYDLRVRGEGADLHVLLGQVAQRPPATA